MGKIKILPDIVCHHIAAGEVVERPAAVVKELMENSLDAASNSITVTFEKGGIKLIEVVDDGEGMDREDALLALERHATSKIQSVADLENITFYGFRGEALSSIAAVSRFELITRPRSEEVGTVIKVEGGIISSVRLQGTSPGTRINVKDLFYNVPARRKFLKSEHTERSHILEQFRRLAIANPNVSFRLYESGRLLSHYKTCATLQDRVDQIFGQEIVENLAFFEQESDLFKVKGYIGTPKLYRPNANFMYFFVNKRPFKDFFLQKMVRSVYRLMIPEDMFPCSFIFIETVAGAVDVNVHPAKQEVRFSNINHLVHMIKKGIESTILDHSSSMSVAYGSGPYDNNNIPVPTLWEGEIKTISYSTFSREKAFNNTVVKVADFPFGSGPVSVLGTLGNTYIICRNDKGLILIDFHAAHERMIFNRIVSSLLPLSSQKLASALVIYILPEEAELLEDRKETLSLLGYDLELFGADAVVIRSVPSIATDLQQEELIRELIRNLLGDATEANILERFASTVACHRALRAGKDLCPEEISWLLEEMKKESSLFTCPHGRPVWIEISLGEIARRFGRT